MKDKDNNLDNRTLCLIVSFNGETTIETSIRSMLPQLGPADMLLVIDNASTDNTIERVNKINSDRLETLLLPVNSGVAKAYNIGIEKAMAKGYRWLFLLDQDSICSPTCFEILIKEGLRFKERNENLGCLFPRARSKTYPDNIYYPYRWSGSDLIPVIPTSKKKNLPVPVHSSITSGTLYYVDALIKIKGFCERYFIDFVDHDCHLRLARRGYKIYWITQATLFHELGEEIKLNNGNIVSIHQPTRYYYIGRNWLDGYWRFGRVKGVRSFIRLVKRQIRLLQDVDPNHSESMRYFRKGVFDAVIRRFGPL